MYITWRTGAKVAGVLPEYGIFHPKQAHASVSLSELWLDSNAWVEELLSLPPPEPEYARIIWEKSEEERCAGVITACYTKEDLDAKYDRGQYRPIKGFLLWQESHNAYRVIDNGKSSETNDIVEAVE